MITDNTVITKITLISTCYKVVNQCYCKKRFKITQLSQYC